MLLKESVPGRNGPILQRRLMAAAAFGARTWAGHLLAQRPLGVGISSYNGSGINWTSVKNSGISFAWAKATEGTSITDADFAINENNGKAAGVYLGAYHFAHPGVGQPGFGLRSFFGQWREVI